VLRGGWTSGGRGWGYAARLRVVIPQAPPAGRLREGFAPAGPGQPGRRTVEPAPARCSLRAHGAAGVARRSWATLFVALLRAKPDPRAAGDTP
jgi:hypothetical protein